VGVNASEAVDKSSKSCAHTVRQPFRYIVLLRRLLTDPALEGVSHVVRYVDSIYRMHDAAANASRFFVVSQMIDEVHERDINTDFLLILLRDLLVQRPDLRVVLMSATMDAESFGNYFAQGRANAVPVLSVPTQPRHPVEVIYLDELAGDASGDLGFSRDLTSLADALLMHNDQLLNMELEEAMEERQAAGELEALARAEDEGELLQSDSDTDSDDAETALLQNNRVEVLKRAVSMRRGESATKRPKVDKDFDANDAIVSLTVKLAQHLGQELVEGGQRGSVLCFLPGACQN
jgi:HrpA-like RNA helicase